MEEIKTDEIELQGRKKLKLKKWLKRIFLVFTFFAVAFLVCMIYLYAKTFNIKYEPKTIEKYWLENNLENKFIANGNQIAVDVPDEVVSTEVMRRLKEIKLPSYFRIDGVNVSAEQERIYMNSRFHGMPLPISMAFHLTLEDHNIIIDFSDMIIGDKGIKLTEETSSKMMALLFKDKLPIVLNSEAILDVNLVWITQISLVEGHYVLGIEINEVKIKEALKKIQDSANEELLSLFKTSDINSEVRASEYIENVENLKEKDIEQLINDILNHSEIAKDILLLADVDVAKDMFAAYSKYLKGVDQVALFETKKTLLIGILTPYCNQIIKALNNVYFSDDAMYINKGKPYLLREQREITISQVATEQKLKVPSKTLEKLSFCYDTENDLLLISYQLSEDAYLILNGNEGKNMGAETYQKTFAYEDTGTADFVKDLPTWEGIKKEIESYFQAEDVFIRYMKADQKYAFVIASPKYNYQNYWVFALVRNEDTWSILEENIASLDDLNKEHPDFNMATATGEIQTVQMHNLGEEMLTVILEDLVNKSIIKSKEGYTIDYCSYGDAYIDFLLSDGKEYVYLVYSMYLHTVYDKATAIKTWEDLPEIITLQEPPSI